ncbi:hypothetical protein, partial [Cerasicoccus maritimus]|uniref:hypothetical protein n=1 Tax=Cerasicoccus maritimus TaxID=490089 RepID=UPI0028528D30
RRVDPRMPGLQLQTPLQPHPTTTKRLKSTNKPQRRTKPLPQNSNTPRKTTGSYQKSPIDHAATNSSTDNAFKGNS